MIDVGAHVVGTYVCITYIGSYVLQFLCGTKMRRKLRRGGNKERPCSEAGLIPVRRKV